MKVRRLPFKEAATFFESIGLDTDQDTVEVSTELIARAFRDPVALRLVSAKIADVIQSDVDPVIRLIAELFWQENPRRSHLVKRIEDTLVGIYERHGEAVAVNFLGAVKEAILAREFAAQLVDVTRAR